ncbi:hypothetical protein RRG08_007267 [Elysia crispata]|uniref:Protein vein n=1 Tax=Elysia crispata TaxID=231223 RepID=A0AAE0ZSP4_9GAST|nr:hypothetical protein RRG08_007267 [Elysia crispata]
MASGEFPISAALLLINFSLLITWSAADECGTKFVDPSSSTVLAQIVVQGKVDTMIPVSHDVLSHSANVTIAKVYKGMDSLKEMGIPPGGNVMVEKFGPETDPDECVADMSAMTSEEDLLFFLRPSASHGVMQLTALPLPAEITVMATVERSLCATCVSPPKINRVMCRHCAHAPVIRKGKGRKVKMGQRARLGCYANGKPPPKFYWTKSGVPVTSGSKGIVIRSTNTSSLLIVRKVRSAHIGEYVCKAENAIGESEKALLLEVNKQTQSSKPKYNVRNAPDKRVCDRVVCLNGGTCYYSPSLDLSFCKCTKGFEGVKCENDISGPEVPRVTTKPLKNVSDPVDNPPSEQLRLNNSMGNISETSASRSRTKFSPSLDGIKSNETTHHSVYNNSTSQSSRDMLTTPLATMSLYANEGTSTPETTRFPGSNDTQTQTSEPRKHRKDTRENTSTSKFRPISNVDDAALKLIRSRLADNQLKSSQCSPTFHDFCENGGTCSYVLVLDVTVCICPAGFNGSRCQTTFQQKQDFDSNSLKENRTFSNEVGNNTDIIASFSEQTRVSDRERNSVANLKDRIKAHTPKPGKGNRSSRKYQATNKRQLKSKNESKMCRRLHRSKVRSFRSQLRAWS